MNDMRAVIVPRSDQTNADDLIGGPLTITIRDVTIKAGAEQPVAISFEGDNGKPYKPCKSMARVMVQCWGPDASKYIGRSMTLYRDPKVKWGGMAVGGIRISHLSDISDTVVMALTETKGSRKPFTVKPLVTDKPQETHQAAEKPAPKKSLREIIREKLDACTTPDEVAEVADFPAHVKKALEAAPEEVRQEIDEMLQDAFARVNGEERAEV